MGRLFLTQNLNTMQVENESWMENVLLTRLQKKDPGSFVLFLSLVKDTRWEDTETEMSRIVKGRADNKRQSKLLIDELFGRWQENSFNKVNGPFSSWLLAQIDQELKVRKESST
jgi:hypothetical protein